MIKDEVSFPDFQKLDMRVGLVVSAEAVAGSANLIRLKVNLGEDYREHIILTGLAKWFKPEQLVGKKYVFLANLAAKRMMGEESHGMMICAVPDGKPSLIPVKKAIPEGTIVR